MKKELRRYFKKKRNELSDKEALSELIIKKLVSTAAYKNADTLLLYYAVSGEVETKALFRKALSDGKRAAFPLCLDGDGHMEFYLVTDENDFVDEMYSIKAPDKSRCQKLKHTKNAICLVPGLSFDKKGYRLGYGKGYYDRYLKSFEGLSVGVCYDSLLSESLPWEQTDEKVSLLITDKQIYNFN